MVLLPLLLVPTCAAACSVYRYNVDLAKVILVQRICEISFYRKSHQINTWLRALCYRQDLGGFDHGSVYVTPGLVKDGVHLPQRGTGSLHRSLRGSWKEL